MTEYEKLKSRIYESIAAMREEVFWFEEATGIEGNTYLKLALDKCLNELLDLKNAPIEA